MIRIEKIKLSHRAISMLLVIFGALWGLDYYRGRGDFVALEAGSQQPVAPFDVAGPN